MLIKPANKDSVSKHNEELLNDKDSVDISLAHKTEDNAVDMYAIKMRSSNSIYDRHKAAAQVAKESMGKINENADLPSKNKEEIDSMFVELDTLSE